MSNTYATEITEMINKLRNEVSDLACGAAIDASCLVLHDHGLNPVTVPEPELSIMQTLIEIGYLQSVIDFSLDTIA